MSAAALLGVIDLRQGLAVHAIAGRREHYRPLRVPACPEADPVVLAEHYRELGVGGLYVADLDRITARSDASQAALARLLALRMPLWIDRGMTTVRDYDDAELWRRDQSAPAGQGEVTWIVGTETLGSLAQLREILARQVPQPGGSLHGLAAESPATAAAVAVSLDLRDGRVVSAARELTGREPAAAAEALAHAGARRLIVLDVARVGTAAGPSTAELCRQLRKALPDITILSGGGVRSEADAEQLFAAGCRWVLAGTWLHSRSCD